MKGCHPEEPGQPQGVGPCKSHEVQEDQVQRLWSRYEFFDSYELDTFGVCVFHFPTHESVMEK